MHRMKALVLVGLTAAAMFAGQAYATAVNEAPPPNWILSLSGQPIPTGYTQYTVDFTATDAFTNITFALRDDPAYIYLDNISVASLLDPGTNLIQNGGFEGGNATTGGNASAPVDWQYLNIYGATYGGEVTCNNEGQGGSNCAWYDGAVQAYDGITQGINTIIGQTYQISFWTYENSGQADWSEFSTNGDTTDTGGNGINLAVYATNGIPKAAVPEPAALGMFGFGMLLVGGFFTLRRREPQSA